MKAIAKFSILLAVVIALSLSVFLYPKNVSASTLTISHTYNPSTQTVEFTTTILSSTISLANFTLLNSVCTSPVGENNCYADVKFNTILSSFSGATVSGFSSPDLSASSLNFNTVRGSVGNYTFVTWKNVTVPNNVTDVTTSCSSGVCISTPTGWHWNNYTKTIEVPLFSNLGLGLQNGEFRIYGTVSNNANIDWMPTFLGQQVSEFAWWNTSYNYKYFINELTTNNYPIAVNNTVKVGGQAIAWALVNNDSSIYCVNAGCTTGGYAIANDTAQKFWENETNNTGILGGVEGNSPHSVWDSNYIGVYHFRDASGGQVSDSSQFNNSLTSSVSNWNWTTSGLFGEGLKTVIAGAYLSTTSTLLNSSIGTETLEAWVNLASLTVTDGYVARAGAVTLIFTGTQFECQVFDAGSTPHNTLTTGITISAGTWYYVVCNYNGTYANAYLNGNFNASTSQTFGGGVNGGSISIGVNTVQTPSMTLDEMRISTNTSRSQDYMTQTYNNGINTLVTLGAQQTNTVKSNTIINDTINGYPNQNVTITNGQTLTMNITTNNTDATNNISVYLNSSLVASNIGQNYNYTNSSLGAGLWNITTISNATTNFNSNSTQFYVNVISYGNILNTSYKIGQNITLNASMSGFVSFVDNVSCSASANATNSCNDYVYTNTLNYTLPQMMLQQYSGGNATIVVTILNTTANQNQTFTRWWNQSSSTWRKDNATYATFLTQNYFYNSSNFMNINNPSTFYSDNSISIGTARGIYTTLFTPLLGGSSMIINNFRIEFVTNQSGTNPQSDIGLIDVPNLCTAGNGYCVVNKAGSGKNFASYTGGTGNTLLSLGSATVGNTNYTFTRNSTSGWNFNINDGTSGNVINSTYNNMSYFTVEQENAGANDITFISNISIIRMGDRPEIYSFGAVVGGSSTPVLSFSLNSSTSPASYSSVTTNFTWDVNNQTNPFANATLDLDGVNSTMLIKSQTSTDTVPIYNQTLGAGTHWYLMSAYDTGNTYNQTSNSTFTINTGTPNVGVFTNDTNANISVTYPSTVVKVTGNSTSGGVLPTFNLYWVNNTGSSFSLGSGSSVASTFQFPAGNNNQLIYNTSGNANWTSATNNTIYVVAAHGILNATITGSNVTYPTAVNIIPSESNNSVDADINYTFWRNNTLVSSASASNPSADTSLLGGGTYNYVINSTGGTNWTSTPSISNRLIVISKATPTLNSFINGNPSNQTTIWSNIVNISANSSSTICTDCSFQLWNGSTNIVNGSSVWSNIQSKSGTYLITYNQTNVSATNYSTTSNTTLYLIVNQAWGQLSQINANASYNYDLGLSQPIVNYSIINYTSTNATSSFNQTNNVTANYILQLNFSGQVPTNMSFTNLYGFNISVPTNSSVVIGGTNSTGLSCGIVNAGNYTWCSFNISAYNVAGLVNYTENVSDYPPFYNSSSFQAVSGSTSGIYSTLQSNATWNYTNFTWQYNLSLSQLASGTIRLAVQDNSGIYQETVQFGTTDNNCDTSSTTYSNLTFNGNAFYYCGKDEVSQEYVKVLVPHFSTWQTLLLGSNPPQGGTGNSGGGGGGGVTYVNVTNVTNVTAPILNASFIFNHDQIVIPAIAGQCGNASFTILDNGPTNITLDVFASGQAGGWIQGLSPKAPISINTGNLQTIQIQMCIPQGIKSDTYSAYLQFIDRSTKVYKTATLSVAVGDLVSQVVIGGENKLSEQLIFGNGFILPYFGLMAFIGSWFASLFILSKYLKKIPQFRDSKSYPAVFASVISILVLMVL